MENVEKSNSEYSKAKKRSDLINIIKAYRAERTKGDFRRLENFGFKVYSQSDEDGIIREIFRRIGTTNRTFVEFGAEIGLETNCRLLLEEGWKGLWIEGMPQYARALTERFKEEIKSGQLRFIEQYVNRDNINDLITSAGLSGEIDFLSIDIDGNDYHVFEAIQVIRPRVVCVEHLGSLAPPIEWIMPYDPSFRWTGKEQTSASLTSLAKLANRKGYELVGCGLYSPNGFYVRKDLIGDKFSPPFTAERLYNLYNYQKIVSFPAGSDIF